MIRYSPVLFLGHGGVVAASTSLDVVKGDAPTTSEDRTSQDCIRVAYDYQVGQFRPALKSLESGQCQSQLMSVGS